MLDIKYKVSLTMQFKDGIELITRSSWTIGDYELLRESKLSSGTSIWDVYTHHQDYLSVELIKYHNRFNEIYGVNWFALATKSPAETTEYADKMIFAAEVAREFNKIRANN